MFKFGIEMISMTCRLKERDKIQLQRKGEACEDGKREDGNRANSDIGPV